ncbi:TIGR02270 family protein [Myxococcus llanfairpwllgwyngyllgogerychwyrndrobwllllantysiliogogogochensis]|uniref:TIGR02270 family protein n=1 Tax=Myxococcus llanfairpwllgwyngyllgogerychwyrndrobwllllantysiliogogogochensis TaxID=2590453 RepID=A0A540WI85_9BACT|nr:TIGR02270 family protein [Myxococcus llanfairpwllgwyngyllgogerychwyrndrobwllllantysiliogogogochensis]TQF08729.1 TIGR02270 family protein [Myxococcus llanfairpwllgwyngyllgogerychwyrndrobwllllantysiliogogogochensis]
MMLVDVWEEHLDEASFRWEQWEQALVAPDATLLATAEREERLLGHLEGLAEQEALEAVVRPAFDSEEAARVSVATHVLLSQGAVDEVLSRLRGSEVEPRVAMCRALEVSEVAGLSTALESLLKLGDVDLQARVLETLAGRQGTSPEVLARYFPHDEPRARIAALHGARPLPEELARRMLPALLASAHPDIRLAAVEAGLTAGLRLAWEACGREARGLTPEAMVLLAIGGGEEDTDFLVGLAKDDEFRPEVVWALGFSGRLAAMDFCAELLNVRGVARLAGEAFSAMTGLQLEGPYALLEEEEPDESEDPEADLTVRPEDDLPWPNVSAVRGWWAESRSRFVEGQRYLLGQPFSGVVLMEALESSSMRRRHVLVRELAIRTRGQHVIPTRAFTHRQREALARARGARLVLGSGPLVSTLR